MEVQINLEQGWKKTKACSIEEQQKIMRQYKVAIILETVDYVAGNMSSPWASPGNFNPGRFRSFPIPFPPFD